MVSAREEPSLMRRALDHGAVGFIPKSTNAAGIGKAIRQALDDECWMPAAAMQVAQAAGRLAVDPDSVVAPPDEAE